MTLALMVVGTVAIFFVFATGGLASKTLASAMAVDAALREHRALAETTRELFFMLTLGFAALLFAPRVLGRELESSFNTALLAIFLVVYASGALFLVHTTFHGKQLVQKLGAKTATTCQWLGKERTQ